MNPELKLQAECTIWFRNNMIKHRGKFRRVKNETDKFGTTELQRIKQGVENRSTGIVRGTWDSFFVTRPITWIEFKSEKGVLTKEQKEFKEMGITVGWNFYIIKNLEQFQYLSGELFKD
jgi:hypothetical protein